MAEGLKVAGSLGVGLRLRHDCSNITTAFEWAADHDRWIMAGELLTGSQCAYQLEGRMIDLRGCQRASTITAVSVPLDRMGLSGFKSTYVAPGSAGELLARAEVEAGTSSSNALRSNAAALATVFPLWARATDAFYDGLFEEALGRVPVGTAGDDVAAGRVTVERSAGDPDHATETAREPSDREQFGNADVELRQGSS